MILVQVYGQAIIQLIHMYLKGIVSVFDLLCIYNAKNTNN